MKSLIGISRIFLSFTDNCFRKFDSTALISRNLPVNRIWNQQIAGLRHSVPWIDDYQNYKREIPIPTEADENLARDIITEINEQISKKRVGRLFAVVQLCGKQFKVTTNDIIVIQGYWPPNPGDELNLEKILLLGGSDFTLIGKPILSKELVSVDATVIEKTFSHTKSRFNFKPRKNHRRLNFCRTQHTMLRINSINVTDKIGEKKEVEGLDKVF